MKKLSGFLILIALFTSATNAQSDADAVSLLKTVSKKYASYSTMSMDVVVSIATPEMSVDEKMSGNATIKGDKFMLSFEEQDVYCDGKTMWIYLKDYNEVQVSTFNPKEEFFTPDRIFKLAEKDFSSFMGDSYSENGKSIQIIQLVPNNKDESYSKIKMHINKANSSIVKAEVFEKSGSRYVFGIRNFVSNKSISDSKFVFSKADHEGVDVVDLRE